MELENVSTKRTKNIAIVFAGGVGQRFGSELPKQFHEVCGKDIIIHTLERFQNHPEIDEIYVGCREENLYYLANLVISHRITKIPNGGIVPGGASGQDTIYRILKRAKEDNDEDAIVLINDGVRPIVTDEDISLNIRSVIERGSTVTVKKFVATPLYSETGEVINDIIDRNKMFEGVAPQSFRLGHILDAHELIRKNDPNYEGIYDGAGIVDSAGLIRAAFKEPIYIVIGNPYNMKVTSFLDKYIVRAVIEAQDEINNENKKTKIYQDMESVSEEAALKVKLLKLGGDTDEIK